MKNTVFSAHGIIRSLLIAAKTFPEYRWEVAPKDAMLNQFLESSDNDPKLLRYFPQQCIGDISIDSHLNLIGMQSNTRFVASIEGDSINNRGNIKVTSGYSLLSDYMGAKVSLSNGYTLWVVQTKGHAIPNIQAFCESYVANAPRPMRESIQECYSALVFPHFDTVSDHTLFSRAPHTTFGGMHVEFAHRSRFTVSARNVTPKNAPECAGGRESFTITHPFVAFVTKPQLNTPVIVGSFIK